MASSLQRLCSHGQALRTALSSLSRPFSASSDALMEVKPGEIGKVFPMNIFSGGLLFIHQLELLLSKELEKPAGGRSILCQHKTDCNFCRWENPLMGWTSTGDPYANVGDAGLSFESEDAAKEFAQRHGWDYVVKKRHTPLLKV
ncbi:hypothetical protein K2173_004760 [Erythroxylum novogranatense]|uniref:NADH dehydrogenase [ubiquinone] iron-sulfur protein 4, mitochondrial n=1 Tax=Erythroxylum novogranatense TaxID=1862640 RepID=A0AAV8SJT3_9ROSI|nr:hypothetical protein K2173_004760 [Erythroxylum novogranatense]